MNNKAVTLSLVMGVVAALFVSTYIQSIEEQSKKKFGTQVLVVKAARDIAEQETIMENSTQLELMPENFVEPTAVSFGSEGADELAAGEGLAVDNPIAIKKMKSLHGSVALVPIRKGEQLTRNMIAAPSIRTGLAPQISPGKRAVSVQVGGATAVGGLIKPGDRVDVMVVVDLGSGKENRMAKTLLQDVVVLATGRNITRNPARVVESDPISGKERFKSLTEDVNYQTVAIEVDPQQAQLIALLGSDATVFLSLRNNDDSERPQVSAVTATDLLGTDSSRVQRAPAGGGRR